MVLIPPPMKIRNLCFKLRWISRQYKNGQEDPPQITKTEDKLARKSQAINPMYTKL